MEFITAKYDGCQVDHGQSKQNNHQHIGQKKATLRAT